jgi:hypothetical protein
MYLRNFNFEVDLKDSWEFPDIIEEHQLARQRLEEFYRSIRPPIWRRLVKKFLPLMFKQMLKRLMR